MVFSFFEYFEVRRMKGFIYLAGDSCEDGGMVILPPLFAALSWAHLHHGNHIVPGITKHEALSQNKLGGVT